MKLYISSSPENAKKIDVIVNELGNAGFEVYQRKDIQDSEKQLIEQIVNLIENCDKYLIGISVDSVVSKNVESELNLAISASKPIIPFELEVVDFPAAIKYQLAGLHIISFVGYFRTGMEELLEAIQTTSATKNVNNRLSKIQQNPTFRPYPTDETIRWYGHHITIRNVAGWRYLGLATDTTVFIDGYKVGEAGGWATKDVVSANFMHRGRSQNILCTVTKGEYSVEINSRLIQRGHTETYKSMFVGIIYITLFLLVSGSCCYFYYIVSSF